MSSAIEVLREHLKDQQWFLEARIFKSDAKKDKELINALKEALLALEKEQSGLNCIGCGSVAKLKVCCNSCYQELKVRSEKLSRLEKWLEQSIRDCEKEISCYDRSDDQWACVNEKLELVKEVHEVLEDMKVCEVLEKQ